MGKKVLGKNRKQWQKSINDHVSKFIDKLTTDDILGFTLGAWAFSASHDPKDFILSILGYKLARVEGGTPPVSQIAGLGLLAFTGLSAAGNIPIGVDAEGKPILASSLITGKKTGIPYPIMPLPIVLFELAQEMQERGIPIGLPWNIPLVP